MFIIMPLGFAEANGTLADTQMADLMELRDLDDYPCSDSYLYSEKIPLPDVENTDFLFGVSWFYLTPAIPQPTILPPS